MRGRVIQKWFNQESEKRNKSLFIKILIGMIVGILITRSISLKHGMDLHPDEPVFYLSSSSVVHEDYQYTAVKSYPSGAFVFQMPFQFVGRILVMKFRPESSVTDPYYLQLFGRVASVFYFCIGSILGLLLIQKKSKGNGWALVYAFTMVFSLFHIEQSRYGTGETITFFLTMSILFLLDRFLEEEDRTFDLYMACFLTGAITAVKYSLVLFLILPIGAIFLKQTQKRERFKRCVFLFVLFLFGLIVFSPDCFKDPGFFMRAFFTEFDAYATGMKNLAGEGAPLSNFIATVIYSMLYADIPFNIVFAAYGIYFFRKYTKDKTCFFSILVPCFTGCFLIMNVFSNLLFFRSLYPFFFLQNLYASLGLFRIIQVLLKKRKRILQILLTGMMVFFVVRGSMFTVSLAGQSKKEMIQHIILNNENAKSGTKVVLAGSTSNRVNYLTTSDKTLTTEVANLWTFIAKKDDVYQTGDFLLVGDMTTWTRSRPLAGKMSGTYEQLKETWDEFQEKNEQYLIVKQDCDFEQLFYGGWIHGSMLCTFEFPQYFVYYKPNEDV